MTEKNILPIHVAIIPDGNRRWARSRGLKPWEGHEAGAENMEALVRRALDLGIKSLSFWGSSLENLKKRPLEEKRALLGIYERYFTKLIESEDIVKNEVRINVLGRWEEQFPGKLTKILKSGIEKTRHHQKHLLNFFLAYNGDDEMIEAIRSIVNEFSGQPEKITAETIKEHLMTRDLPPVDLLIRTGGDPHLSNGFMMWEVANSQLYFFEGNFPDFQPDDLVVAIEEFGQRERRMGK